MKKIATYAFLILILVASITYIVKDPKNGGTFAKAVVGSDYENTMKQDILCLMLGYPEYIEGVEKGSDNKVYIVLSSGQKLVYDDKAEKSIEEKILNPDLQDMLELNYPLSTNGELMDKSFNPGRGRVYGLLKETYGSSQQQIEKQLTSVWLGGQSLLFNKRNGAAQELKAAIEELTSLAKSNNKVAGALYPSSGTYNYRVISGTNRLSPHAFGIAIDLAHDSRDYWKWATREQGQVRLKEYPKELVEIFEKHNFIWGGKWGYFDTLHFEYRPEIILKSRYFGKYQKGDIWYKGVLKDDMVNQYIEIIEKTLR